MRKKSRTLAYRLSMSSITKTPQYIVQPYNLPRGRAVGRGKVAEAALTAEAGVPHAAQAAQAAEGRMGVRKGGAFFWTTRVSRHAAWQRLFSRHVVA